MRKPELAAAIAEKADLTKDQANRVLNAVLEEITGALNRKDSVTLVGFGTFVQRHRGARTGKNPQTGQPVKIKASNTVAFKPGKSLKDAMAMPNIYFDAKGLIVEEGSDLVNLQGELTRLGHVVTTGGLPSKLAGAQKTDAGWVGAVDPRSTGEAVSELP